MSDLRKLESEFAGLLARMSAPARRKLAVEIARTLRASQSKRITAQKNPDGSPFTPRSRPNGDASKKRKRKNRVRKMFQKLKTVRYLKTRSTADAAVVTFDGRVRRLAWEHQIGGKARDGINVPRRLLLGLTAPEREQITETIINHLADD